MALNPGYLGLCDIAGVKVRVTAFSVNVKQEVEFYDHIMGLRDSVSSGMDTKGDVGNLNIQKHVWRPGTKIVTGSITFPAQLEALQKVFDLTKTGDEFILTMTYSCGEIERVFDHCRVNTMSITATAGDLLQVQVDVMGRHMFEGTGSRPYITPSKLVTWDQINLTTSSDNPVQAFNFSVNNNCIPIYTAGNNYLNDLFPKKIRVGMQSLTGSLTYYVKGVDYADLNPLTTNDDIGISITDTCSDDFQEALCVIYKPIERGASTKILLHTLPFVGVGKAMGGKKVFDADATSNSPVTSFGGIGDVELSWSVSSDITSNDISSFVIEENVGGNYSSVGSVTYSDGVFIYMFNIDRPIGQHVFRISSVGSIGSTQDINVEVI